jgi:hypothetical protein
MPRELCINLQPESASQTRQRRRIFKKPLSSADELQVQRFANPVRLVAAVSPTLPSDFHFCGELANRSRLPEPQRKAAWLRRALWICLPILAVVFPSLCWCVPPSRQIPLSEDEVRAAVLFHLTQFVDWPEKDESNPYRICVAGSAPTSVALEHLVEGKSVKSHRIRVRQIAGPTETRGCQIVFISMCARPRLQQYMTSLRDSNILTVGEQPGFIDLGGMIQLFFQSQRVGLVVNLETIQRSHLTVSSKLLRLGHRPGEKIAVENR